MHSVHLIEYHSVAANTLRMAKAQQKEDGTDSHIVKQSGTAKVTEQFDENEMH